MAYQQNQIDLHAYIWVRFNGKIDDVNELSNVSSITEKSSYTKLLNRVIRADMTGQQVVQYIRTTAGRILFNKVVQEALSN